MTLEQKLDLILQHIRLVNQLHEAREEKHQNVRKQDFKLAIDSRDKEKAIEQQIKDNAALIDSLISNLETKNQDI